MEANSSLPNDTARQNQRDVQKLGAQRINSDHLILGGNSFRREGVFVRLCH